MLLLMFIYCGIYVFIGKPNKDISDKVKDMDIGEDRGAEQRFDYDSDEERNNDEEMREGEKNEKAPGLFLIE